MKINKTSVSSTYNSVNTINRKKSSKLKYKNLKYNNQTIRDDVNNIKKY